MNIQHSTPMTPLRARMIADMTVRNLGPASQVGHVRACKRFAAWLERSPETAEPDDMRDFQQHLIETCTSICTRNRTMTGVKFLFRVTLRRHDLVAEVFSLKEDTLSYLVIDQKGRSYRVDVSDLGSGLCDEGEFDTALASLQGSDLKRKMKGLSKQLKVYESRKPS